MQISHHLLELCLQIVRFHHRDFALWAVNWAVNWTQWKGKWVVMMFLSVPHPSLSHEGEQRINPLTLLAAGSGQRERQGQNLSGVKE